MGRTLGRILRAHARSAGIVYTVAGLLLLTASAAVLTAYLSGDASREPSSALAPVVGDLDDLTAAPAKEIGARPGPKDKTLRLTIPKMKRVKSDVIPYAEGDDTKTLDKNAAIHLANTGFPWQDDANVYIAGHRLGYPGTASFLAFYDLDVLREGDEVMVEDSEGGRYVYRVFDKFVVEPTNISVVRPAKDVDMLTLQTCTLPDYSKRLIVRAERVSESHQMSAASERGGSISNPDAALRGAA